MTLICVHLELLSMANSNWLSNITSDDLNVLRRDVSSDDVTKYQSFLDQTGSGLDYLCLSKEEQTQIRQTVDNPRSALAGPELLMWNNIRRERRIFYRFYS